MARSEQTESIRPWGAFQPGGFLRQVIAVTRRLPPGQVGRWCAGLIYRLVGWRLGPPLDCLVFGTRMRLHPADNPVEAVGLFTPQMFAVTQRRFLDGLFGMKFSMIDIGADVGLLSLYAAARAPQDARIIAVEADPELYRRLRYNIGASGIPTLHARQMIITDEDGMIMLPRRFGDGTHAHASKNNKADSVAVAAETIVGLLDGHQLQQVVVMRLGPTGCEFDALAEFFTTAARDRFPTVLMVTANTAWPESDPVRLAGLHGYRVIDDQGDETIMARSDIKAEQVIESV